MARGPDGRFPFIKLKGETMAFEAGTAPGAEAGPEPGPVLQKRTVFYRGVFLEVYVTGGGQA